MTYQDIDGWFDFQELYAAQVRRAAEGARIVEVGAWKGRSTAYLAQQIKDSGKRIELHVVDTWQGSPPVERNEGCPASSVDEFRANMEACGLAGAITVHQCNSVTAARSFEDGALDFVFIDADHREESVYADLCAWWPKIRPGGLLAGHDFDLTGVKKALDRFCLERELGTYGDGACGPEGFHCYGLPKPIAEPAKILLALPGYDGNGSTKGLVTATRFNYSGPGSVVIEMQYTSLLAANFNSFWCMALNDPSYTHFAMLHADIEPSRYWLNVLMHELVAEKAQMVSVVVPIKDDCGITSTGTYDLRSKWAPLRRYTMQEVLTMPATFGPEGTPYPGHPLVLNTGCWLADLRDARWRAINESGELICHFEINDRINYVDGKYAPQCQPEDFNFSHLAQSLGMRCVATRKVQLDHIGRFRFPNYALWGKWTQDEQTRPLWSTVNGGRA